MDNYSKYILFDKNSYYLFPNYNNSFASWIKDKTWTHVLTLSNRDFGEHVDSNSHDDGSNFAETVECFFYRMADKVYGIGKWAKRIEHCTFFENRTRYGLKTNWHSHSLIAIEPEFANKFEKETQKQWARLDPLGSLRFEAITDERGGVEGAARYCSKFEYTNELMFSHMGEIANKKHSS